MLTQTPVYLWLIRQGVNFNHPVYDSAVVAAASEEEAKRIHPRKLRTHPTLVSETDLQAALESEDGGGDWAAARHVAVWRLGVAAEGIAAGTVVCASYNVG
jgi:hypothetical protein